MTAGLWFRVILRELCGIQPKDISWYIGRVQDLSHGGLLGMDSRPPTEVSTTWLTKEQTFDVMLDKGEIDAAYGFAPRHDTKLMTLNIDRYGGTPLEGNPRLRKMFADGGLSIVDQFYKKTGIVPANHVIVAQRRLLEENQLASAKEIFRLFSESKQPRLRARQFRQPRLPLFRTQRSRQPGKNGWRRSLPVRHRQQSPDARDTVSQFARGRVNPAPGKDRRSIFPRTARHLAARKFAICNL